MDYRTLPSNSGLISLCRLLCDAVSRRHERFGENTLNTLMRTKELPARHAGTGPGTRQIRPRPLADRKCRRQLRRFPDGSNVTKILWFGRTTLNESHRSFHDANALGHLSFQAADSLSGT